MKIRFVWIGKTKDPNLSALIENFSARVARFVSIEVTELKDPKIADERRQVAAEGERILAAVDASDRVVVLDPAGKPWSSPAVADFLDKHLREDSRRLAFVIGGYSGLADAVKKRADRVWSLSPLTFTHEMTRFLVVEQLYRAFCILKNHPYSK